MTKLSEILKKSQVFLTLTNEQGELHEAGEPTYVKPLSRKTIMRWQTENWKNNFPFTFAILHTAKEIIDARIITPVFPDTEKIIEMEY